MKSSLMLFLPLTLVAFVGVACGDDDGDTTGTGGSATTGSSMGGDSSTSSTTSGMGGDATTTSSTTTGGMGGGGGCTPEAGCFDYCDFTPTANIDFATQVMPVFEASCNSGNCHGSVNNPDAGLYLGDQNNTPPATITQVYNNLLANASNAPGMQRVVPGDAFNSWLMVKLDGDMSCSQSTCGNGGNCGEPMPRGNGPTPSAQDLVNIRSWIENGAPAP